MVSQNQEGRRIVFQKLKLQQELSILKKEKLDLYQKTTEMQRRISDMENIIGYDVKN